MTDAFDGEAINRADREFLASLSDHPLAHHPLYSVPCPPPDPNNPDAAFEAALDWMLVNYGYFAGAYIGAGGFISLVDGKIIKKNSLRDLMMPYTIEGPPGPNGGKPKLVHVVDVMLKHPQRIQIDGVQCRCDKLRPMFEEDGLTIYNRYWPPAHPTRGGEIETFKTFFARLIPDDTERTWVWNYLAHKTRRPWVPMVAIIMVADDHGTGRGTLFEILRLLFGKTYVIPCTFGALTGRSAGSRFNDRLANALIVTVGEADDEDSDQQARRRITYEALKNVIEPSPTAPRTFEKKGQDSYDQESAMSVLIATNHRDLVKLPPGDRRFEVILCGAKMTAEERAEIRAWMDIPENIGALYRALLTTPAMPLDVFDPYGEPPMFAGRREMIGMGKSQLEDAYEAAIDALEGCALFTATQAQKLINYLGAYITSSDTGKTRYIVAKNAYRLRERDEANNRIIYRQRQEIIYSCTRADRRRWQKADTRMIIAALDRTEERVAQVISPKQDALAELIRAQKANSSESETEDVS